MVRYQSPDGHVHPPEKEQLLLYFCKGFVFLIGFLTLILGLFMTGYLGDYPTVAYLAVVDKLVRMDASASDHTIPSFTTLRIYFLMIFGSIVIMIFAVIGIVGAATRHKALIGAYMLFCSLMGAKMLVFGFLLLNRIEFLTPVIDRQAATYCDPVVFTRQLSNLKCTKPVSDGDHKPSPIPCGASCKLRRDLLARFDGCDLLTKMCTDFEFSQLGVADCISHGIVAAPSFLADKEKSVCRELCNKDIWCTSFVHSGASDAAPARCEIKTNMTVIDEGFGVRDYTLQFGWTKVPGGEANTASELQQGTGLECYAKRGPNFLSAFHDVSRKGANITFCLAFCLLVSLAFTCFHQYNVSMRRKSRHSAAQLCLTVFCPCCADHHGSRLVEESESSLESDYDS